MRSHFDIFISYRRNGGSERAEMLKLMFEKNGYSSKKIFMDTHTLKASDVKPRLQEAVEASDNFILLITKGCFDEIKEEDLWIFEIKEAIKNHKNIIPVFFDGIESFDGIDLPLDLQLLSSKNGVEYDHKYSDACFNKICSFLVRHESKPNTSFFVVLVSVLISIIVFLSYKVYTYYHSEKPETQEQKVPPKTTIIYLNGNLTINNDFWNKIQKDEYWKKDVKRTIELAVAQELGMQYYYSSLGLHELAEEDNNSKLEVILSETKGTYHDQLDSFIQRQKEELHYQIRKAKESHKEFYTTPTGIEFDLKEIAF